MSIGKPYLVQVFFSIYICKSLFTISHMKENTVTIKGVKTKATS